jgi:DNA-binding SARP family transcriptional activator
VNHGRFLKAEIATLEQSHLKMLESLFGAQLLIGRHRDVLSDLASLVVQHPFNEGLHAQFMLALYRSGHRVRALEVFARLRSTLAADLGIGPAPYLQDLHQAVLDADSSLNSTVVMPDVGIGSPAAKA